MCRCSYCDYPRRTSEFYYATADWKDADCRATQHQFNEHVNDHQVEFARNVSKRMGTIIDVEDIETLGDIITNYDKIVAGMGHGMISNNEKFNEELEKLVGEM